MAKKKKYIPNVINPVLASGKHWESCPFGDGHNGEDLISRGPDDKSASITNIIAIADGKVYKTGYGIKAGYYVYILHSNGYYSAYMHLEKGSIKVKKGQVIKKGQLLGREGMSGNATGPHLHLAIMPKIGTYVDPYDYLIGKKSLDEWVTGEYITLKSKYVRKTPEVASNKVKYNSLEKTIKNKCNKDVKGYAKFKTGVKVQITEFKTDNKGNLWGKAYNYWLCVRDSTGNQVKKV